VIVILISFVIMILIAIAIVIVIAIVFVNVIGRYHKCSGRVGRCT